MVNWAPLFQFCAAFVKGAIVTIFICHLRRWLDLLPQTTWLRCECW